MAVAIFLCCPLEHDVIQSKIAIPSAKGLMDFNMFRSEDNCVNFSFLKTMSELLFELTRSVCCHQKATAIVFIIIRTLDCVVLFDFNMLRCEDNGMSFSFPKTLVRAAH